MQEENKIVNTYECKGALYSRLSCWTNLTAVPAQGINRSPEVEVRQNLENAGAKEGELQLQTRSKSISVTGMAYQWLSDESYEWVEVDTLHHSKMKWLHGIPLN